MSQYAPGWALTISLEPTFEVRERCGISTSTRNMIKKIWPYQLPNMDPEILAKLVFCFENDPERSDGIISGAQDSIGICVPKLCRHNHTINKNNGDPFGLTIIITSLWLKAVHSDRYRGVLPSLGPGQGL